jgi:hypothetical protein
LAQFVAAFIFNSGEKTPVALAIPSQRARCEIIHMAKSAWKNLFPPKIQIAAASAM